MAPKRKTYATESMSGMLFELCDHPAHAEQKFADGQRVKLYDEEKYPVPLFPDQRSIYVGGQLMGYCSAVAGGGIQWTCPPSTTPYMLAQMESFAAKHTGGLTEGLVAPPPPIPEEEDSDDE